LCAAAAAAAAAAAGRHAHELFNGGELIETDAVPQSKLRGDGPEGNQS
jgi:hypothetical protein